VWVDSLYALKEESLHCWKNILKIVACMRIEGLEVKLPPLETNTLKAGGGLRSGGRTECEYD